MQINLDAYDPKPAADLGRPMQLTTDNGPLPIFFTVLGQDSDVFAEQIKENSRENAALKASGLHVVANSPDHVQKQSIRSLARIITGWWTVVDGKRRDQITFNGTDWLDFSHENAKEALSRAWIREQVAMYTLNRANFLPPASSETPAKSGEKVSAPTPDATSK